MPRNASLGQVGLLDVALFRISWQILQFHKLTPYSCHILFLTIPLHLQFISSTTTAPTCTLHSVLFTKDWASIHQKHGNNRTKTDHLFKVLSKCNSKFDCLVYAMLYIKDIKPSLNTQADSIRAKLFTWQLRTFFIFFIIFFFSYCVSYLRNYTHWTRKYFMYCFKFYIFVFTLYNLILFHFSTW